MQGLVSHLRKWQAVLCVVMLLAGALEARTKEEVLVHFDAKDGAYPISDLISDTHGNLYGTTPAGGDSGSGCGFGGCGVAFQLSPASGGGWKYSVLYYFKGGTDAANPSGRLAIDTKGNLFGASSSGGAFGGGTVFELTRASDGKWKESLAHSFPGNGLDGVLPAGDLSFDEKGNLYGTTAEGTDSAPGSKIYLLKPIKGGAWEETILYSFDHTGDPTGAAVAADSKGNVYGFGGNGGSSQQGVAFQLLRTSSGWNYSVFYNFSCSDMLGCTPGYPTLDKNGDLYGATIFGGALGQGTIFKFTPQSNGWQASVVYDFSDQRIGDPLRIVLDGQGDILGSNTGGGTAGDGLAWELKPASGGWKVVILHNFQGGGDGSEPVGITIGKDGNLYGPTTYGGGRYGYGTVFEIMP